MPDVSHDGWLVMDTGGPDLARVADFGNYTSNVSPMWRTAFAAAGEPISLSDTEGRTAGDVLPLLRRAVQHMAGHPDMYREMDPPNGWGNYAGALAYLRTVERQCALHPKAIVQWWV